MPHLLPFSKPVEKPSRQPFALSRKQIYLILIGILLLAFFYVQLVHFPDELAATRSSIAAANREKNIRPLRVKFNKSKNDTDGDAAIGQIPELTKFTGPTNPRQTAVRDAMHHAWSAYQRWAFGHDHLRPISKNYHDWYGVGLTIVDSLDTLLLMNMHEEFNQARRWVEQELRFDQNNRLVNLFETTIRALAGLLSAYHLTGDQMFLEKASDLGARLIGGVTQSSSGVPFTDVHLPTGTGKMSSWSGESTLSEVTSIQLEFRDLSRVTQNNTFEQAAFAVSEHIHKIGCHKNDGLCFMFLSPQDGKFREPTTITFGARTDSYYEYLLKQWLQMGRQSGVDWLRDDYLRAMETMHEKLWKHSEPSKLGFIGEILTGGQQFSPKMDHLVCFLAGTLSLGAQNGLPSWHMDVAKELARTCFEMYNSTKTKLGPEIAHFNMRVEASDKDLFIKPLDAHSLLRPEAVEAWFYLYQFTGDRQYQDWGWAVFEAIERHAKIPSGGYASVNSVKQIPVTHRDMMESFFLAETLKYLYLLFGDDQKAVLPLDRWVFNTEGHPLPIRSN